MKTTYSLAAAVAALAFAGAPNAIAEPGKGRPDTAPGQTKAKDKDKDAERGNSGQNPNSGDAAKPGKKPAAPPANSPDAIYDLPPRGNAYGYRCRNFSKKKVKGEKGTPFSRCVKAMAQADKANKKQRKVAAKTAKKACKALSTKKRAGQRKSDFAKCVVEAKKVIKAKKAQAV